MPSKRQPKPLRMICTETMSEMLIEQVLFSTEEKQEMEIKEILYRHAPPLLIQELQASVMQMLGRKYSSRSTPCLISSLLRILLHPKSTEISLSDLAYIGNVELDSLDVVETALLNQLPLMSQVTHVDLSTHGFKITFPSCSDEILEGLGTWCPLLKVLNINFNNRVTGEGLLCLHPSDEHPGCVKLERLFILDCSVQPEDVALLISTFPYLQIIGYKELGTSLHILRTRPKKYGLRDLNHRLKLTHIDNTMSGVQRCDGQIIDFLCKVCPDVENLKVRVHDEDLNRICNLKNIKHLELRFFTGIHHPIGNCTESYLKNYGACLASFTIYCHLLCSQHVLAITENCPNLKKLFLHANVAVINMPLEPSKNKLKKLELLNIRLGDNELVMNPAACDFITFLLREMLLLQELYIMVRSPGFNHQYISFILHMNPLSHLKNMIIDAPRRTLAAPMLELTTETAFMIINLCKKLKILGNLISWTTTQTQVTQLRNLCRTCNYNITILHAKSNKLNTKYL